MSQRRRRRPDDDYGDESFPPGRLFRRLFSRESPRIATFNATVALNALAAPSKSRICVDVFFAAAAKRPPLRSNTIPGGNYPREMIFARRPN